jgi:ferredoxin
MADPNMAWDDNVLDARIPGYPVFYVDHMCILCSVCVAAAPANFGNAPSEDHNRVYRQPASAEELELCQSALENCPVDAIGKLP